METNTCPNCKAKPAATIENKKVVLQCAQHGHMAMGDTLDSAERNWNAYLSFVKAA